MSRRTEMLLKNMEFVGYNDLNKKPGFQMGMHRTEDGRYFIYSACFRDNGFNIIEVTDPKNPVVTDQVVYLTADEEDNYHVAQANEKLDENGYFVRNSVSGRYREETQEYDKTLFDYMDVSPQMVFSVATALIPFLENDDANRALMGANMQRQAVPLLTTEAPVVGTGMEPKAAVDSGVCVVAKRAGVIERACSNEITIKYDDDGSKETIKLTKFSRSNQSNCYNQRPIVFKGNHVEAGQVIADGPSTSNGELGLGKNPLIGFMTWEGYNYEDAVLLSERLVQDDVYTSIHIEEYEAEARDTKLGPEEITRDVPGVGDDALKDLDERGIIRIGAEVKEGDILVGHEAIVIYLGDAFHSQYFLSHTFSSYVISAGPTGEAC